MADNNQMTYSDAESLLLNQIYAPVFFEKLATDYGIRPSSEGEAIEILRLAGRLQQLDAMHQVKEASSRSSIISLATQSLDTIMGGMGLPAQANGYAEAEIKEAASQLAQVPHIRNAALLYQDAVRQQLGR